MTRRRKVPSVKQSANRLKTQPQDAVMQRARRLLADDVSLDHAYAVINRQPDDMLAESTKQAVDWLRGYGAAGELKSWVGRHPQFEAIKAYLRGKHG